MLTTLVKAGASLDATDALWGNTPLMAAVATAQLEEANLLIQNDPFQRNLFDVYDADVSENDEIGKILDEAARAASIHPPRATDDDPLLAIIAARILDMAEHAHAEGDWAWIP